MAEAGEQSPLSHWADEYERLRTLASALSDENDEEGFDFNYAQAEKVRDLIFATPARNAANAVTKLRFMAKIAKEREGDLTDIRLVDALLDVARFLEA